MSLINQVLQDLERRRASATELGVLPNQVRVLPQEDKSSLPWWLISIASAAGLVILFGWQFYNSPAPVAQASPPSVVAANSPPQLTGPASRLALDLENVPPAAAVNEMPAQRTPAAPEKSRNAARNTVPSQPPLATEKLVASNVAVAAAPLPAAPTTEPARPVATPVAETAKPASALANVTPVPATGATKPAAPASKAVDMPVENKVQAALPNPQIDKRSQTLTPQQLAESAYRDGANFLNQGRQPEAQEAFRSALQHHPAHVAARQGLFGLLLDAKKNGEAEQLLQEGLKVNPNQPGFAMALSSLQYERGDVAGAVETMQRTSSAAQSSPDYIARLAGLLQRQARHKEAVESYQAALRLAPGSGVWLMGLAISLQALNRNGEAQDAYRRARATNTLNHDLQAFVDQRLKQLQ